MEKKVIISESFYFKLINDIETFGFKDKSNEYKLNEFYNTVIINTYRYRKENNNLIINKIKDVLLDKDHTLVNNQIIKSINELDHNFLFNQSVNDLALNISNKLYANNENNTVKKKIFIRGTKHTNSLLEEIINSSFDTPASTIFRDLLQEYMSYPMYIRERILFYDNYLKLIELKKNNIKCLIESKQIYKNFETNEMYRNSFEFEIFDIKPGKEEYHTYLIGVGKNTNNKYEEKIMSIKLSNINKVISLNKLSLLKEEDINTINARLIKGPEYINGDETKITIEFTSYGVDLFNIFYKDRPKPEKTNGNIYEFSYNEKSMLNYLKQFGRHAKVIKPDSLKNKLKDFYMKAFNEYNN